MIPHELVPFHVLAPVSLGGGLNGNIHRLQNTSSYEDGQVELVVVSGGPVFMFFGRRDPADIAKSVHSASADDIDFDVAASVNVPGRVHIEGLTGFSIYSDVESVGYVGISPP